MEDKKEALATKKDVIAPKEDISKFAIKIAGNKGETIKWMFIFRANY
ncbi:hypothetical protein [Parafilimonas sp.]